MATVDPREAEQARELAQSAADMARERVDVTCYDFVCDEFAEELAERANADGFTIDAGTDDVKEAFERAGYDAP